MRTILFLLQKEFLQIFRNRAMLPIIFVMPILQLAILSFAATYELKEVRFALVDLDQSVLSRQLVSRFQATGYFRQEYEFFNTQQALDELDKGAIKMVVDIPSHFERDITSGNPAPVQIIIDAVDGSTAGLIQSYGASILNDFNREHLSQLRLKTEYTSLQNSRKINVIPINWYNPNLEYITYMVPGILVVLVSMIGIFLSGMNIVREREIGTIEQLNVTPIHKYQFMVGKLLPFWFIGLFDLFIGLMIARFGFGIPFLGSLVTIFVVAGIFLIVVQSLGLFISTITRTQQQAMFIAWFIMVIFILMGGLFTPIESMPIWAQHLTLANPVAYFIKIIRMVLLKGAGWHEIRNMVLILAGMGIFVLSISINRYKKTTG